MADTAIAVTAGTGTNVDTRTEATNGNHRQVVVLGDPSVNAGVAPVDATNGLSVNVTNASLTVGTHAVTQSGTWTVQPGNTANTTAWKVDNSGVTQPISAASLPLPTGAATSANQSTANTSLSTIATNSGTQATAANQTSVIGTKAAGTAAASSLLVGGVYNSAGVTLTTGQQASAQLDASGFLKVNVAAGGASGGTSSSFGSAYPSTGTAVGASDGTNMVALKADASSNLKVTLNTGTTNATVKAGSTGAAATSDTALVVTVRDANANGQTTLSASAPVAIASDQTIINKAVTQSSGVTDSRVVSAATTNATSLKASAGNIFSIDVYNVAAYDVFLKLYNKASAPTVGTDTPVWTIPIKTGTGFSRDFPRGRNFATGIAYAITKLQADSDTTAVVASDLTGTIGWI